MFPKLLSDWGTAPEVGDVALEGDILEAPAHRNPHSNSQEVMGVHIPHLLGDNNLRTRRACSQAVAWVGRGQEDIEGELRWEVPSVLQ